MLGYYQTESEPNQGTMSMPGDTISSNLEPGMNPVKSLVCSPDLTVFAAPGCSVETNPNSPITADVIDSGKYQCLLCQKSFAQKSMYQSHLRSHGKDGEDPYRCNICGKTFAVPARLTRHYRTHTGEKPYQCEYCSKSFSVKENLSVHRRIHTKERPYKCDVCGRAFEHSGKLHRHMRIHTGERPHKCTVCSKTFIQSGQLVIHMRTHTGEKPYVCKSCKKGFTCSKQLKVHTRTHTGEKPYTCDICRKAFGYNHVLKLHQVSHYGEKVYKCTICNETFGSKKTMELHIKKHPDSPSAIAVAAAAAVVAAAAAITDHTTTGGAPSPSGVVDGGGGSPLVIGKPNVDVPQQGGVSSLPNIAADNKENLKTEEVCPETNVYAVQRDFAYYLYPSVGREQYSQPVAPSMSVNSVTEPALTEIDEKRFQASVRVSSSLEPSHVLFYPEPTYAGFGLTASSGGGGGGGNTDFNTDCSSLLNLPGNDARRRVEAALEAVEEERQREHGVGKVNPLLTPPSSNPESPMSSPDPLDLAIPPRETLILPPRKRSKMILQSMESERNGDLIAISQRQNSVIQFARAS